MKDKLYVYESANKNELSIGNSHGTLRFYRSEAQQYFQVYALTEKDIEATCKPYVLTSADCLWILELFDKQKSHLNLAKDRIRHRIQKQFLEEYGL